MELSGLHSSQALTLDLHQPTLDTAVPGVKCISELEDSASGFTDNVDQVQRQYMEEAFSVQTPSTSPTLDLSKGQEQILSPITQSYVAIVEASSLSDIDHRQAAVQSLEDSVSYCEATSVAGASSVTGHHSGKLQAELRTDSTTVWDLDLVEQGDAPGTQSDQLPLLDPKVHSSVAVTSSSAVEGGSFLVLQSQNNTVQLTPGSDDLQNCIPLLVLAKNDQSNTYEASIVLKSDSTLTSNADSGVVNPLELTNTALSGCPDEDDPQSMPVVSESNALTPDDVADAQSKLGSDASTQDVSYNYVCDIDGCDRCFSGVGYLKYHLIMHDRQKALACPYQSCGRKFAWPAHLKYHKLTHQNRRAFKCDVAGCNKAFYTGQRLSVHMRTHTGERPFSCPEKGCTKSFTTAGNLKNHIRIHSGDRPYMCDIEGCGRSFTEHSSLRKHQVVHSGQKCFQCDFCGQMFSQSGSRNVHVRKHHSQATDQNKLQPASLGGQLMEPGQDLPGVGPNNQAVLVMKHNGDEVLPYSDNVVTVTTQPMGGEGDRVTLTAVMGATHSTESIEHRSITTNSGANVVVLSQPQEIVDIATGCHDSGQSNDVIYDNKLLRSNLDHEEITCGISVSS